jgi:2-succinyl-5-enolpyruvyl-6-hydroxy-3-cyclohexene-1-carboxylate synthase
MNPSTAQARVIIDELRRCGVTDAVVAPGSRSAPLALALAAESRIRLHVRIDERSASYLAIGLARASGRPAVVVCTSGTAAAALHPAVLEADLGGVPLLVLTADRPPELRGTGATQTVDQLGLFGRAVRMFAEVGVAEPVVGQVAYWRSLIGRAVAAAAGGPVHLNVGFREPLVPDGDPSWPEPLDGRAGGRPWVQARAPQSVRPDLPELLGPRLPERGVVVAGDGVVDPAAVAGLAEELGWPLLAEPTSGARRGPNAIAAHPLLLGDPWFAEEAAEVILTVGRPGLSRAVLRWIARCERQIVVDPSAQWADPTRTATLVLPDLPATTGRRQPEESAWLRRWRQAGCAAVAVLDEVVCTDPLSEPGVARTLGAVLESGALLFAGPSRPIRDLDLCLPARADLRVLANRGVNGIDGVVSAAVGAALAHRRERGGRSVALLGDLTYLYDRNGLLLGSGEERPDLTLVVVDNDGGGIFSTLPQAGVDHFERVFGTPHGIDLCADAATAGIGATTVTTAAELAEAIQEPHGFRMIRVPTERADTAKLHRALQEAVCAALRP